MSTSSDLAIRAAGVSKVYRLYARERYRLLDVLGLLPKSSGAYREHKAIDGLSLEILRGEKVAIIGRNGAGKSTLLKLVSQVVQPTSGVLEVVPRVHALLQIGTGFHPDFTGRQNVYAYLSQIGIGGAHADRLFREVVDFAEVEHYIDQPVKTYSTGMAVRLMFSTSTAIDPDLLLLDEVLGVGDAYFTEKSFDRIRQLCASRGTTLLLVTHAVYDAARLCERMIWIDRGQILLDGPASAVIRAYEDSIRVQEEHRLRTKRLLSAAALATGGPAPVTPLLVEIAAARNAPQPCPVYISAIDVRDGETLVASVPLDSDSPGGGLAGVHSEGTVWGDPLEWHGARSRPMLPYGSPFHRVAGTLAIPSAAIGQHHPLTLSVRFWSDQPCELELRAFADGWSADLGSLPRVAGRWAEHRVALDVGAHVNSFVPAPNRAGSFGTGDVRITTVSFVDAAGAARDVLPHGEPAVLRIGYAIVNPAVNPRVQVIVAMHRDGVHDVCRVIARDLAFDVARPSGDIQLTIPRIDLTDGRYSLTVMFAEEGYYDRRQTTFFAINPGVYSCLSKAFDFLIAGAGAIGEGTITVKDATWTLR